MLMMGPKKDKLVTIIAGKFGEEKEAPESESVDYEKGLKAAVKKLIDCMGSKDESGCVAALQEFIVINDAMEDAKEMESEEPEEGSEEE